MHLHDSDHVMVAAQTPC